MVKRGGKGCSKCLRVLGGSCLISPDPHFLIFKSRAVIPVSAGNIAPLSSRSHSSSESLQGSRQKPGSQVLSSHGGGSGFQPPSSRGSTWPGLANQHIAFLWGPIRTSQGKGSGQRSLGSRAPLTVDLTQKMEVQGDRTTLCRRPSCHQQLRRGGRLQRSWIQPYSRIFQRHGLRFPSCSHQKPV